MKYCFQLEDYIMSKMYNIIIERLNNKREELAKLQEQFKVMCHNNII